MRIALVSRTTAIGGGASSVAESLTRELRRQGEQADLITLHPHQPNPVAQPLYRWRWLAAALAQMQTTNQRLFGLVPPLETPALLRRLRGYDLVHFHDVWSAISPWTISRACREMPTVLTLHDCSPFTGGCLYMLDCTRYRQQCGCCPEKLASKHPLYHWDFSHTALMLKRRLLRPSPVSLITPSHWMAARAAESEVFPSAATVIPNGCDLECFHPHRREAARARWGIAPEERVVLLSAASLEDPRKGITDAIAALNSLAPEHPELSILLMGRNTATVRERLARFRCHDLGYLSRQEDTADAYAASDLFLSPSHADNYPLAILESMSSGTPVIAYRAGGVSEIISDQINGILCELHAIKQLSFSILSVLRTNKLREQLSIQSRAHAIASHSWCKRTIDHTTLYRSVI